jgi:DNA-binding NarL/FixJ family response regulator
VTDAGDTSRAIRVVLVDDQALLRTAFRLILDQSDDIVVVGEAADGESGVAVVERTAPDVVLMDVRMPGTDGIESTRRIQALFAGRAERERPKILILTTFDLDEYVYDALLAGASGFLLKDALAEDLLSAVRAVASGEAVTSPSVTRRLITHFLDRGGPQPAGGDPAGADRLAPLTGREREVLTLIARGRSNGEIAADLHLSAGTVRTHIGRIFAKLDLRDRVQAVILGYECGLVTRPAP